MVVADVESPRLKMEPIDKTSIWTEVDNCLKVNDSKKLEKVIEKRGFATVWRPEDSPWKQTSLHRSAELESIECMSVLIRDARLNGVDIDVPDSNGNTPLFSAVEALKLDSVSKLLAAEVHVNARNEQGHSVLHVIGYAVAKAKDKVKEDKLFRCLGMFLNHPNIDIEAHNNSGYTPLMSASKKMPSDEVARRNSNLVPFCKKLLTAGASLEAVDKKGVTARKILEDQNALSDVLTNQTTPPPRPFVSQLLDALILRADGEEVNELLSGQPQDEAKIASNSYIGAHNVLFYVVDKSEPQTVEALLKAGADSGKQQLSGELCLHRALSRGNPEILNFLIENIKEKTKQRKIDLNYQSFGLLQRLLENQKKNPSSDSEHIKCLKRLLEDDIVLNIHENTEGGVKQSILHVAASFNNQEALRLFIENGAFLGARKTVFGEDHGNIYSAMKLDTLESAMDGCITYKPSVEGDTEDILSPDYTLNLDYSFLIPHFDLDSKRGPPEINEVKTLMELSQSRTHKKAIKHPLIQTLLYAKWWKVLPFYLANLLLYLSFVIFLTLFMYGLKDLRILQEKATHFTPSNATIEEQIQTTSNHVNIYMSFLIPLTLYMFVREIFQVLYTFRTYLKNFENYLEWFLILIVITLCVSNPGIGLTKHMAAWAMIIAWYEFVLLLGRAPFLSIYVTMLRHVSWNFLKLIFLYSALILAFTVSFNIILQPTDMAEESMSSFASFWSTIPKAIVMGTGEFEYSDLSADFLSSSEILFATSTVLIFLVFLFLIFLVLMNVMNGLAVTDTQKVVEEATLYSLKSRLELIYLIEEFLLMMPFASRCLDRIHLISGVNKRHRMVAKINETDRMKRIGYGDQNDTFCKLDRDTAHVLRSYRLRALTEDDSMTQCLSLLNELRGLALLSQSGTPSRPGTPAVQRRLGAAAGNK